MSNNGFLKYPDENRAYGIDWTNRLSNANNGNADTISGSVWETEAGITVENNSTTGNITVIQVSGGVADESYVLINTVTLTDSLYELQEYITVRVVPFPAD